MLAAKRFAQSLHNAAFAVNRLASTGGGSGQILTTLGFAAAGNQGAFSTANASTWVDIPNTSFQMVVSRTVDFEYRFYVAAHLSAAGALGYVRGNIVGYDVSASLLFGATSTTNGTLWYEPLAAGKGPLVPGTYTVKLQAATDNNGFNITIDQFFHQIKQLC